jgi:DNA-directed RNA polymerase subunit RPC12/RpoP
VYGVTPRVPYAARMDILEGFSVHSLAGREYAIPADGDKTLPEVVTVEVHSVSVDEFVVQLAPPMRLLFLTSAELRCPHCDKKLGDKLAGTYETTCPRCKRRVTFTR